MTPGGAPLAPPPDQRVSISVPSISTVDSSISMNGSPTAPPLPPSLPCLRPVCLTECRADCPLPVARICIEACQKSCEERCPAPSMISSAPISTITALPTTTSTPSSTISTRTTITNTLSWSTIPPFSSIPMTSSTMPVSIDQPVQSSTTHSQGPQIVVSMQLGECATRCGDRCSHACAALNLGGCDTICKITCEVSCSPPPPARSNTSSSQVDMPVVLQPLQLPNGLPVQSQQLQQVQQAAIAPSDASTQPQQQPAAPLLFFPYTIAAQPPLDSVGSTPSSSVSPLGFAQPSVQSPPPTPPLQPSSTLPLQQTIPIIRLTVAPSSVPPQSPQPPSGAAPLCGHAAAHPQGCAACGDVRPAEPPAQLPPSPSTPGTPEGRRVVDLGASLAQLCAVVPSCAPGCSPSCLEQTAKRCAPDCVAACRVQCAGQSQPAEACAPACNADEFLRYCESYSECVAVSKLEERLCIGNSRHRPYWLPSFHDPKQCYEKLKNDYKLLDHLEVEVEKKYTACLIEQTVPMTEEQSNGQRCSDRLIQDAPRFSFARTISYVPTNCFTGLTRRLEKECGRLKGCCAATNRCHHVLNDSEEARQLNSTRAELWKRARGCERGESIEPLPLALQIAAQNDEELAWAPKGNITFRIRDQETIQRQESERKQAKERLEDVARLHREEL
ncbi:hypothetical protein PENTCL1PPCAC_6128 [Pristionchus entomophagus]|uniref:Uncharacterized protein n=1 Tax=Pristionchus entomophagus TaxID=358040 RepID=A0AAV5STN0_9BILA|nr:hypothetical protein PENTCL1PPCAC_6128 [Pristionchus entomophagus]